MFNENSMIEVFKTNVSSDQQAEGFLRLLRLYYPDAEVSFDLNDCDKILRIEGTMLNPVKIWHIATLNNICIERLD